MPRIDRQFIADALIASAWAALLSSFPSTIYELITDGDPLESTRAAGAMLIPFSSTDSQLIVAACVVHVAITLFWAFILAWLLPRRHIIWTAIGAAALIAFLDIKVIARFFFPDVYALDFWPQFADHIAWGAALGATLEWRWRERKMAPPGEKPIS
jgi:hypothetical protein